MNICIFGAGAWGTAMALHLERCGHSVTLVPRRIEQALALASSYENTEYLPGYQLPGGIQIGFEPAPVLMEAEAVLLACPAKALRPPLPAASPSIGRCMAIEAVCRTVQGFGCGDAENSLGNG